MRKNYKGFAWRLDNLKELCNSLIEEITDNYDTFRALHDDEGITDVVVRYALDENRFGYAYMGDFFFIDDCMYVISNDEKFRDYYNDEMPDIAAEMHETRWYRDEKYVARVIFAGVRTPFRDNIGDWIYTGDMVCANDHITSGVCAFPPFNDSAKIDIPDNYGLMLDNCMFPLRDCKKLERLGTIYFNMDASETEINMESIIGGTVQHGDFSEEFMKCAQYTPSYQKEYWKYIALEELGVEYYWRK